MKNMERLHKTKNKVEKSYTSEFGRFKVQAVRDYKADTRTDLATGKTESTGLPNSNVLYYELSDGAWCCVRPSGTEPKIKFYFGVKGDSLESSKEQLQELEDALMKKFK